MSKNKLDKTECFGEHKGSSRKNGHAFRRRDTLRASKIMAERTLAMEKITPVWNSTIIRYLPDAEGEVDGVILKNLVTGEESALDVRCVFMAIGHTPNSAFLGDLVDRNEAGYIVRTGQDGSTRTKTPGLFAAGDVADPHFRQAITSAGLGCSAALEAERYLLNL